MLICFFSATTYLYRLFRPEFLRLNPVPLCSGMVAHRHMHNYARACTRTRVHIHARTGTITHARTHPRTHKKAARTHPPTHAHIHAQTRRRHRSHTSAIMLTLWLHVQIHFRSLPLAKTRPRTARKWLPPRSGWKVCVCVWVRMCLNACVGFNTCECVRVCVLLCLSLYFLFVLVCTQSSRLILFFSSLHRRSTFELRTRTGRHWRRRLGRRQRGSAAGGGVALARLECTLSAVAVCKR